TRRSAEDTQRVPGISALRASEFSAPLRSIALLRRSPGPVGISIRARVRGLGTGLRGMIQMADLRGPLAPPDNPPHWLGGQPRRRPTGLSPPHSPDQARHPRLPRSPPGRLTARGGPRNARGPTPEGPRAGDKTPAPPFGAFRRGPQAGRRIDLDLDDSRRPRE